MTERSSPENAFGLRWLQDDERGRLVYGPATGDFRSPAEAISILRLGCEQAVLEGRLDGFPPHVRIHGGYAPGLGESVTRFTLTWEPGAASARYAQSTDNPGEGLSGVVDIPVGATLESALRDLLVPDAQDVVGQALEEGKPASMKDVDFWIGAQHFKVSDGERS